MPHMADEYFASLNVYGAVIGKLFELTANDFVQHAGGIDPKNPLQFGNRVRPSLDDFVLVVDGHLDELWCRGELLNSMLPQVRFGVGGD